MIKKPLISIITPFFNEQEGILEYFNTLIPILEKIGSYEVICIDDGSSDLTWSLLTHQSKINKSVKALRFSRNFGKEIALTAGLDHVQGEAAIPIDADLQDPPEMIPEMVKKWKEGYDVVLMKRKTRNEGFLKNLSAKLFYKVISFFTNRQIPEDIGDFRLMSRKAVDAVNSLREKNRFMKGILSWSGFKSTVMLFERPNRLVGKPKQNYRKLFRLAFDGIFAFSSFPLKIWTILGFFVSSLSFFYGLYLIIQTLVFGNDVPGYTSLMVSILFFNGLLMMSIGMLGEYVRRIFDEVKNRPLYILDEDTSQNPVQDER